MDLELFDIFKFSVCNDIKISWHAVIKAAARSDTEVVSETTKAGGLRGKLNKVVLAYSGGLDTSVIVPWLRYRCCPPFTPIFLLDLSCAFVIFDFSSPLYILIPVNLPVTLYSYFNILFNVADKKKYFI